MVEVPAYNPLNEPQFLHQDVVPVDNIPTKVITCGRWLDEKLPVNEKLLIIVIPGNPGAIEYYEEFVCSLYEGLQRAVPIWAVSHAGHTGLSPEQNTGPQIGDHEEFYNLEGQIQHKIAFISQYVPADRDLILVGHSIGAYIILELFKRIPQLRVIRAFLLFPTIERMALTPQGQWMSLLVNYLKYPMLMGVYAASYLGESAQKGLVSWYLRGRCIPECVIRAALYMFRPECVRAVVVMAKDEFETVQALDVDNIQANLKRVTFYYGATDPWCPASFCQDLKDIFPDGDVRLCQNNFHHAFVLDNGKEMAALLAAWILEGILDTPRDIHAKSLLV